VSCTGGSLIYFEFFSKGRVRGPLFVAYLQEYTVSSNLEMRHAVKLYFHTSIQSGQRGGLILGSSALHGSRRMKGSNQAVERRLREGSIVRVYTTSLYRRFDVILTGSVSNTVMRGVGFRFASSTWSREK